MLKDGLNWWLSAHVELIKILQVANQYRATVADILEAFIVVFWFITKTTMEYNV